jgi:hypothetical protein
MKLKVYVDGPAFVDGSDLDSFLDILTNYKLAFGNCLQQSAKASDVPKPLQPTLRISTVSKGSLNIDLVTQATAAIAPLAPQIFGHAWQLYKAAYDLIGIVSGYFKRTGNQMTITINNSPGAVVNVVTGNQVSTTQQVLDAACSVFPYFEKLCDLIGRRKANKIIMQTEEDDAPEILFDEQNAGLYKLPATDATDSEPVEFECNIYRFNVRTLNGNMECFDGDVSTNRPFIAKDNLIDACIDALKSETVNVKAIRDMEVNALGETKIIRFRLLDVIQDADYYK